MAFMAMRFGDLIRTRREARGLMAFELAAVLKRPASFVSRLETEAFKETPPPDVLGALSSALDIPMADLLGSLGYRIADESPAYDADSSQIARLIAGWSPAQRALLWRYIEAVSAALDAVDPIDTDGDGDDEATA